MTFPTELWFHVFSFLTQKSQAKFSCILNLYNLSTEEIQLLWSSNDLWFDCARKGYTKLIQLLIQDGADINGQNKYGNTALHFASYYSHKDCLETLLRAGAGVNVQDNRGWTALYWASYYSHKDCLEALLRAGADVNIQDNLGHT